MNLNISSVCHQHYFLSLHKQKASSFNLFEVPFSLCLTFKSLASSQKHRADYYVQLCTSREQRERCSQRATWEEKPTGYMSASIWLLSFEIGSRNETKCKTKWQKMDLFPCHFEAQQRMKTETTEAFICRATYAVWKLIINQACSSTVLKCTVTGRQRQVQIKLLTSVMKCLLMTVATFPIAQTTETLYNERWKREERFLYSGLQPFEGDTCELNDAHYKQQHGI